MQFWSSKEPVGIIRSYYRATIYTKDRIYPLWCDPEFESNENFFFSGNIKITAVLQDNNSGLLTFPDFGGVSIDQERAETFGLMTVSQDDDRHLECEFRHLSLAEYLTALHVHVSGDSLKGQELEKKSQHKSYVFNPFFFSFLLSPGFPRDRKELIFQYLSGLSSASESKDQMVVKDFLQGLGSSAERKNAIDYLKHIQKMKGEWYNQQGMLRWALDLISTYVNCAVQGQMRLG